MDLLVLSAGLEFQVKTVVIIMTSDIAPRNEFFSVNDHGSCVELGDWCSPWRGLDKQVRL
jgi:hypothetical protein